MIERERAAGRGSEEHYDDSPITSITAAAPRLVMETVAHHESEFDRQMAIRCGVLRDFEGVLAGVKEPEAEHERYMTAARKVMHDHRNVLRALAKSTPHNL